MRRLTDLRSKKIKKTERMDGAVSERMDGAASDKLEASLDSDILYILQRYDSRIKIRSRPVKSKTIFKPSYERNIINSEPVPFDLDITPFVNLETVIIKNSPEISLDVFSSRFIKTLYLSNIPKIIFTSDLKIEEIYLKNVEIELALLLKILSSPHLKSIHFNTVKVFSKDKNICDRVPHESSQPRPSLDPILGFEDDTISSDSAVQHMMSFTSVDESGYRQYNIDIQPYTQDDCVSNRVANQLVTNPSIKACSIINSNIGLAPLIEMRLLRKFNNFTYIAKLQYLFVSYNSSHFNSIETNLEIDFNFVDLENLEKVSVENFHILRSFNLSGIKSLEIMNSSICEKMISKILKECSKLTELAFIGCIFNNNSFFRIVDMFKENLRKINLKDSTLPLNSLEYLKARLSKCKVINRDGSIIRCE